MLQTFLRTLPTLLLTGGTATAGTLVRENFDGPAATGLDGRSPAVHLTAPGAVWTADAIVAADGQVGDGTNTDRGATLDLGQEFAFLPDSTYTLTLDWSGLGNAVLFAGFSTGAPDPAAQMQTQGVNFAARARRITAGTDVLGAWQWPHAGNFSSGNSPTPESGTTTLTLQTRSLADATFTVDGATRGVDLSAGYRHLWIGYEDPTSGTSEARFTGLTLSGPPPSESPPPPPPPVPTLPEMTNLLVIVGDSVGFGDLHCYGGVNLATPALDSLACDGIRFTQFTTAGPGAAPAQFALLSGRVAARSGMTDAAASAGTTGWGAEEWSLAEMLRRRGYATAFVGEWLLGEADGSHPNDQGFQLFHGLPASLDQSPPQVENREVVAASPDPATLLDSLTQRAEGILATATPPFALVFQPPPLPAGPHAGRIEALDQATARLLDALAARGISDETLVLFLGNGGAPRTADGGCNGLFRDGRGTTWEGGLRTPLLARLPGTLPAGQINLSLIWLPDLLPTLAALIDGELAADRPLDGTARPAALAGWQTRPADADSALGYRFTDDGWRVASVRQGRWKSHLLIENIDPENSRPTSGSQLYDLHIDAEERINRASSEPAILSDLAALAAAVGLPATGTTDLPAPKEAVEDGVSLKLQGDSGVHYQFIRPADSIDDHYRLEYSDDLLAWNTVPITDYISSATALADQREEIEIAVALGTAPFDGARRFIRLLAERPAN